METRDAVIALVGALVLAAAVVGVGMAGEEIPLSHHLTYRVAAATHGEGTPHANEASARDVYTFRVTTPNVTRIDFEYGASVSHPTPYTFSVSVKIVAPNGSVTEHDAGPMETNGGPSEHKGNLSLHLAPVPPDRSVVASGSDLDAILAAETNATAMGNWTVEIRFDSGIVPVFEFATRYDATITTWEARVDKDTPPK